MRRNTLFAALCLHAFALSLSAWQKAPALDEILPRIQANLAAFDAALPDFVTNEKVVSKKVVGGRTERQTVTDSVFTCVRQGRGDKARMAETREVTSVDGKAAKKGQRLKGPSIFGGAVAAVLNGTFGPKNAAFHNYSLAGEETLGGRRVLVIAFATKEGQTGLGFGFEGKRVITRDTGKAFIDAESMQVLRLERKFAGLPKSSEVMLTVDYSEVAIDGKILSMPKTVTSVLNRIDSKPPFSGIYTAEYSDYRKFSVATGITYQ